MEPDQAARTFIERMGRHYEEEGMPRIAGRIMGLLLLREEPASLEDVADALQVSKASSSTNCRLLERMGIAERWSRPGDRRNYYRIAPDAFTGSLEAARRRMEDLAALYADALTDLPEGLEAGRRRIRRMHAFHSFLMEELDGLNRRWAERECRGDATGMTEGGEV